MLAPFGSRTRKHQVTWLSGQILTARGRSHGRQGPKGWTVNEIPSTPCAAARPAWPPRSSPAPVSQRPTDAPQQGPETRPSRWFWSPPSSHAGDKGKAKQTAKNLVLCFSPPEAWVCDFLFLLLSFAKAYAFPDFALLKPYVLNSFACHPPILCSGETLCFTDER